MIGGLQLPEMLTWPASARLVGFQRFRSRAPLALLLIAVPVVAVGQTDEIQVYDAEIAEPGVFNLMIHTNYIPIGRKTPDLCPAWRFLTDPNARRAVHVRGGFAGGDQPRFDSD